MSGRWQESQGRRRQERYSKQRERGPKRPREKDRLQGTEKKQGRRQVEEMGCRRHRGQRAPCTNIPTGTHVGVEREVQVAPELLDGAAAPVFKHMQVGTAPELCGAERGRGVSRSRVTDRQTDIVLLAHSMEGSAPSPCATRCGIFRR